MAVARSGFVSLDCADPVALGEFWAAMRGGEIAFTSATTVGVRTDWVWLAALKIPDYVPPTWPGNEVPKQIHLDLAVTAAAGAEGSPLPYGLGRAITNGGGRGTTRPKRLSDVSGRS